MSTNLRRCLWLGAGAVGIILVLFGILTACRSNPVDRSAAAAWVAERHPGVPRLTGAYLESHDSASYLLLDVRSAAEWQVSHLPGALRCEDADAAIAAARQRQVGRIVVYCSIGERSSRLAGQVLAQAPELQVHDLAGGIFTWAAEDRPLIDVAGRPTRLVHPYDAAWGRLLPEDRRAPLP